MEIVKKNRHKKKIRKKKIKRENYNEIFNRIRYNINVEAVPTAKYRGCHLTFFSSTSAYFVNGNT